MKLTVVSTISLLVAISGKATAQEACRNGLTALLTVEQYTAAIIESGYSDYIELQVQLKNKSGRGIRMIDGGIIFQDVLDRDILRIAIDPDLKVETNSTVTQEGRYSNLRLANVSSDDVVISTCVRGVVYQDGEVFKVEE